MDRRPAFAARPQPIMNGTSGGDFSSSSTLLDPASSSTLRARLRSPGLAARIDQKAAPPRRPVTDVYERFRACFAQAVHPAPFARQPDNVAGGDGTLAQLREAFAEAGLRCYSSVAAEIMQAHGEMEARLRALANTSGAVYARTRECYATIGPLSATLCRARDLPSATIASHLSTVQNNLAVAQQELQQLQKEWDGCVAQEEQSWTELRNIQGTVQQAVDGQDDARMVAHDSFKASLDELVDSSEEMLDRLVEEYRELIQDETMCMMQSIMAA